MPRSYAYTDDDPLDGSAYYRLRQVDFDGTATYSPVVTIGASAAAGTWLLATSVARHFTVTAPNGASGRFAVLDMLGRPVYGQAVEAGRAEVELPTLPAGVCLFQLTTAAGRQSLQQVVAGGN